MQTVHAHPADIARLRFPYLLFLDNGERLVRQITVGCLRQAIRLTTGIAAGAATDALRHINQKSLGHFPSPPLPGAAEPGGTFIRS
jgi:hypothetical protein